MSAKRIRQAQCPNCGHWNEFNGTLRSMITTCDGCLFAFNHTAAKQRFVDTEPAREPAPVQIKALAIDGKSWTPAMITDLQAENLRLTAHCNGLVTTLTACLRQMEEDAVRLDMDWRDRSVQQLWKGGDMPLAAKVAKETIELATGRKWGDE